MSFGESILEKIRARGIEIIPVKKNEWRAWPKERLSRDVREMLEKNHREISRESTAEFWELCRCRDKWLVRERK